MGLNQGDTLGPFTILGEIGAGGMGRVYQARDTRLNRVVAIKVLPAGTDVGLELKRRFEREAQAIAGLNHPNICVVHDVGEEHGTSYIVMEYLEGETLASRLSRGALPIRQALQYAVEIVDALDKAHRAGVVHRDLKPANIMLTPAGAKLLDFGLAKLVSSSPERGALEVTTTLSNLTRQGTILGTLQYMAPEQIEGLDVDARTDIFAFGAVLYEMVTGAKAFSGNSQTALLAAILEQAPGAMSSLQQMTPPALERVVSGCLAKAPGDRWQSARDVTLLLEGIAADPLSRGPSPVTRNYAPGIAWSLAVISVLALIIGGLAYYRLPSAQTGPIAFTISHPERSLPRMQLDPFTTISPDGRHIAFTLRHPDGRGELWVRSLDSVEARLLPGTEGAFVPFWSPDSTEIAFFSFTDWQLKVVGHAGGPVRVLCPAKDPLGGTWNRDGTILFSVAATSGSDTRAVPAPGLHRVSEAGGVSTPLTLSGESVSDERTSRRYGASEGWPQFLPNGRQFLYLHRDSNTIRVGRVDSSESTPLLKADSQAIYAPPGYLLFVRGGSLMGQPFDAARLELRGDAFRIAENVRFDASLGGAVFSASATGVLAYSAGVTQGPSRAAWVSRTGQLLEVIDQATISYNNRLSADGSRLVQDRLTPGERSDIWVLDLLRGRNVRVTSSPADEEFPIWSPDGAHVVYGSNQAGVYDLYRTAASGSGGEEVLFKSGLDKRPNDWSSDGRFIAFTASSPETAEDIWLLEVNGGGRGPEPIVHTTAREDHARFSPSGKLIAYRSDRTGRPEIYIQPVPSGVSVPVSANGGFEPFWRHDGQELYFVSPDNWLMAVDIQTDVKAASGIRAAAPTRAFKLPDHCGLVRCIDVGVSRAGRFLVLTAEAEKDAAMHVLLNWTSVFNRSGRHVR